VQKYVDASISKTVNAPNAHTVEDVKKLYMMAYDEGCKGITYMRDGSRLGVLQRVEEKKEEKKEEVVVQKPFVPITPRMPRPMVLMGTTYKTDSPIGKTYITINNDEKGEPFEIFIHNGKSGSDVMAMADALGRMISFVMRLYSPVPARERMREIVSELSGIGGARSVGFGENRVRSLPDAVAKVLAKHGNFRVNGKVEDKPAPTPLATALAQVTASVETNGHSNGITNGSANGNGVTNGHTNGMSNGHTNGQAALALAQTQETVMQQLTISGDQVSVATTVNTTNTNLFDICPECGAGSLAYEEGCQKCYGCGYSAC
jgi:ribonucleoside-diphosphate reductase alpha chain